MPHITHPDHLKLVGRIKELMSLYQKNEDLINIGAYVQGTNPKVDMAVALKDHIDNLLKQSINEAVTPKDLHQGLAQIAQAIH